ncbi:MAG: hypothetical protein H0S80_12055 [Desulfovibrionaceae bacterium]|nr:hypothetical protein [Desulfovibrionaceae bacterium]
MRKYQITLILSVFLVFSLFGCQDASSGAKFAEQDASAEGHKEKAANGFEHDGMGCGPDFRALFDQAVVELRGTGDMDVVVVTDPLCRHCRLAHKLLSEYPEKYGRLRLSFFPRRSFIGSDMAAWILEDLAGNKDIRTYLDWAYTDLKQPKTYDLVEARMIVLAQFVERFPELAAGTELPELAVRLEKEHGPHVAESVMLSSAVELPGTPVLVAGKRVLVGYGPGPWLEALSEKAVCQ